jgi:glycosidase
MWCDSYEIANTVRSQLDNYPKQALDCLMNILGTHDTPRILTILGSDRVPTTKEASESFKLNICEIRKGIDKLKIASLLQFTLYGVPSVYYGDEVGLEGNMDPFNRKCFPWGKENQEILSWYQKLSKIRKNSLFKDGRTNILVQDRGLFVFERTNGDENIIVAVNMGREKYFIKPDRPVYDLLTGARYENRVPLARNGMVVLYEELYD